jgi:hypothetical protein
VTGDKLGAIGEPIAVDTGIGARKPSVLGKLFGRKPKPGIVVYVCCQDCAATVKSSPGSYVARVIAEVNGWPPENAGTTVSDPTARR